VDSRITGFFGADGDGDGDGEGEGVGVGDGAWDGEAAAEAVAEADADGFVFVAAHAVRPNARVRIIRIAMNFFIVPLSFVFLPGGAVRKCF
jgi:hypothetical protein